MHIFICEDDDDILGLIEILLTPFSTQLTKCQEASHVLPTLNSQAPDLIIMDYWIKNTTAAEIIRQIKNVPKLSNVPILLMSAVDNLAAVAANLPVDAILQKPFDIYQFKSIVQRYAKPSSNN